MRGQKTFGDFEYANRKRITRREQFLDMMDKIVPWQDYVEIVRPFYPDGKRGRPTRGIELMLRMYFLQIWFSLSDGMVEESIYDSYAMRKFCGINFTEEQVPDATTLLKFRHLLEKHDLQKKFAERERELLEENGCIMRGGTIVDATIIKAPSSTKNENGERDPEMHSTQKGNEWYFGMKAHIGVDAGSGYVHSVVGTSANVHDIVPAHALIREDDDVFYGDAGYIGIEKREEICSDEHKMGMEYRINRKIGKMRKDRNNPCYRWDLFIESRKSSVRSKVEYVFHVMKNVFGYRKVAYKGLRKNVCRLYMLFSSVNLYMCAKSGGLNWGERFAGCIVSG